MRHIALLTALVATLTTTGQAQQSQFSLMIGGAVSQTPTTAAYARGSLISLAALGATDTDTVVFYARDADNGLHPLSIQPVDRDGSAVMHAVIPNDFLHPWLDIAAVYWTPEGHVRVSNVYRIDFVWP